MPFLVLVASAPRSSRRAQMSRLPLVAAKDKGVLQYSSFLLISTRPVFSKSLAIRSLEKATAYENESLTDSGLGFPFASSASTILS